ncbi:MAG: hypothetical protein L7W43_04435 [Rubripirellula sp.]|nr:hypothetical protein [Rubripirellula sp.]
MPRKTFRNSIVGLAVDRCSYALLQVGKSLKAWALSNDVTNPAGGESVVKR